MEENYHALKGPQQLTFPKGVQLSEEQTIVINDALTDIRTEMCLSYREQCYVLVNLLKTETDKAFVPYEVIGKMFVPERNHGSIIKEYKKYKMIRKPPHRPYLITDEEVQDIKAQLQECEGYPSIDEISIYISMKFNKCPSRNTIKNVIKNRIQGYKIITVKAIDDDRYSVPFEQIKEYYDQLQDELEGVPIGFLFNLDESGQNQFVDAQNISLIVPNDVKLETYPVSRSIKRITLLHCIGSDGSSSDPMIILPRLTIDNEIFDEIPTGSVLFASQTKGFCTHELFTHWFVNKFLPYLKKQRRKYQYEGKCVIIMDGFTGHEKAFDTLENILEQFKIKILMIPPHSSDQVQPLDLFGFNLQKNKTSKYIFNQHYSLQSNTIMAIIEGLNTIKSPHNVKVAWEMAGIYRTRCDRTDDPNKVILQYHIVDMSLNKKIRSETVEEVTLQSSNTRRKKYKVQKPTDIYLKRKEMHLPTPLTLSRSKFTKEEISNILEICEIHENDPIFKKPIPEIKSEDSIEKPKLLLDQQKKPRYLRKATISLPENFHVNNDEKKSEC